MITEIYELYKLYIIYQKLENFKHLPETLCEKDLETQCQKIKQMVLGGGFIYIKFAQWIISRLRSEKSPKLKYLVNYFDDIFDNCPFHNLADTERIFAAEFGRPISEVVTNLQPIASGSVGQVYYAKLIKPYYKCPDCVTKIMAAHTGLCPVCYAELVEIHEVAIKIKHPDVDKQVRDKTRLFNLVMRAQRVKWLKDWLSLHVNIKDFIANLNAQTDFRIEAANNGKFRTNFRESRHIICFPIVLESNSSAMITEFVDGKTIDEIADYAQLKCCLNYGAMIYQMVLIDNFCHGDLHHKNWKIRKITGTDSTADGDYQLIMYDYGICFTTTDIQFNRDIIKAFKNFDVDILINNLGNLIDGEYDDHVRDFAKGIILKYKEQTLDIVHILNQLNGLLKVYNCYLTTDSLNTVILLSLISNTLQKQNMVGGHTISGCVGDTLPSSNVRAKDLDLLAYARSRKAYPELVKYLEAEQRIRRENSNVVLFGAVHCNGMIFDAPDAPE